MAHSNRLVMVFIVLEVIAFTSCKSTQQTDPDQGLKIARAQLGEEIEAFPNATGKYILYVQKPQATASGARKFIVVQSSTFAVVAAQTFIPGYVKWVTDEALEVLSVPGTLKANDDLSNYKKTIPIRSPN